MSLNKFPSVDVERSLVAHYFYNLLSAKAIPHRVKRYILYWLNDRAEMLSLQIPSELSKSIGNIYGAGMELSAFVSAYKSHETKLLKDLKNIGKKAGRADPISRNVKYIIKAFDLPKDAGKILRLIAFSTRYEQLQYFCHCVNEAISPASKTFSTLLDCPVSMIDDLLGPTGFLIEAGVVQIHDDGLDLVGNNGKYRLSKRLDYALDYKYPSFDAFRLGLLGVPQQAQIEMDDYEHIARQRDLACALLKGATKKGGRGINILLYGEPGAGKTELSKVVAKEAGLHLYSAGDHQGLVETDRKGRLADLVLTLRLLRGTKNTAVLFDEMEDIALHLIKRGGSKIYLNRLLETSQTPILWTSNNIDDIDNAVLRRMTLAIDLKTPPAHQRRRMLTRMADRIGVQLKSKELSQLAGRIGASPAVMENAFKVAKYSGGGIDHIEQTVSGICRVISGPQVIQNMPQKGRYDPALVNANMDLEYLTKHIKQGASRQFSLCLSGPPGTGKSAFGRYLASLIGLQVRQLRASDLLSTYVGETEKRIAAAFEGAVDEQACLIFDEADSFLFDRSHAHRSFEVTQVNEMLTWMENHPLPVIFTTNLMGVLDTASLRRFTFHLVFDYLNKNQIAKSWKSFFKKVKMPEALLAIDNLTPGDFAKAVRQAKVLGLQENGQEIVKLLKHMSTEKFGQATSIGFVTS